MWKTVGAALLAIGFVSGTGTGASDPDYVTRLVAALNDDTSYRVRLQAAVFLGRTGHPDAVEPLLAAANSDEHYTVRAAAVTALANLQALPAVPVVIQRAGADPERFVRDEAERALRKYDRIAALPYVTAAFGARDAEVRRVVLRFVGEGPLTQAEPLFVRALADVAVTDVLREQLAKCTNADVEQLLKNALLHRDADVRRGALAVLAARPSAAAGQIVLEVFDREVEDDSVREATVAALRALRTELPTAELARQGVDAVDKAARARALRLLGILGGVEARTALLASLNDAEDFVAGTAVMGLRELGDPTTIPELEKLLANPDKQRIVVHVRTALHHLRKLSEGRHGTP